MNRIPVYLFTGLLESGKTHLIQETLADEEFNRGDNILLLQCEDGEEVLDPSEWRGNGANIFIEPITKSEQLNPDKLSALLKKHKAKMVLAEYNGMWKIDDFYRALPDTWQVYQEICTADATTFLSYNKNMRSMVVDQLQGCEMVIFNRFRDSYDFMEYHKIARAISRNIHIAYEYADGKVQYDDIEDPLPFDLHADVIEVEDRDYALWYRDITEEMEKYEGKTVRFRAIVAKNDRLDARSYVVGRHVMFCCADDISYQGFICNSKKTATPQMKDWVIVTAKVHIKEHPMYRSKGPVLEELSVEPALPPEQEVATFS